MKIQIDTVSKILKIEEQVNLNDLFEMAKQLFPNDAWKEYKLDTNTTILNWGNPIIIDRYPTYSQPFTQPYTPFWWQSPTYISGGTTTISATCSTINSDNSTAGSYTESNNGVYNLEI